MGTEIDMYKSFQIYRNFDRIDDESMEFEWNFFPGYNTLQLNEEVKSLLLRLNEISENFTGRIIFISMFNDIVCGSEHNDKDCLVNVKLVSLYTKRFGKWQLSFIGPGSEKMGFDICEVCPQGVWRMWLEFAESDCPIFRASSPLSRGRLKSKDMINCRYTLFAADQETIETIFRITVSVNQLSLKELIAKICK